MTDEVVKALEEGASEIEMLRRRNEVLAAKVEVMDFFACVLFSSPAARSQEQSVDVAWKMRELAAKIEREMPGAPRSDVPQEERRR